MQPEGRRFEATLVISCSFLNCLSPSIDSFDYLTVLYKCTIISDSVESAVSCPCAIGSHLIIGIVN